MHLQFHTLATTLPSRNTRDSRLSYLYQVASNLERQNINPWYFILHYFFNVAHALWIAATVSCEREHRDTPSRHRLGLHLASPRLHKHTRTTLLQRGQELPTHTEARREEGQHLPASAETRGPEEGDTGGRGHRSGAGGGLGNPLGPARVPARPHPRADPAKPRRPAHRAVTGGPAPPPVAGPGSPMPCQITRGTAAVAQPRHSPSSTSTAALSAAILTGHMTRARHRSGGGGGTRQGRDPSWEAWPSGGGRHPGGGGVTPKSRVRAPALPHPTQVP